jgi:hypothetical protein
MLILFIHCPLFSCAHLCARVTTIARYLHVLFAGLGFGTSVTDTGCQIMTRKAHGKHAGPWLGSNTVTFGIAGALVSSEALCVFRVLQLLKVYFFWQ